MFPPFVCPNCSFHDPDQFPALPPDGGALVTCIDCLSVFRCVAVSVITPDGVGIRIAAEPAEEDWIPDHVLDEDWYSITEFSLLEGIWLLGLHPREWLRLGDEYGADKEARHRLSFIEYVEQRKASR